MKQVTDDSKDWFSIELKNENENTLLIPGGKLFIISDIQHRRTHALLSCSHQFNMKQLTVTRTSCSEISCLQSCWSVLTLLDGRAAEGSDSSTADSMFSTVICNPHFLNSLMRPSSHPDTGPVSKLKLLSVMFRTRRAWRLWVQETSSSRSPDAASCPKTGGRIWTWTWRTTPMKETHSSTTRCPNLRRPTAGEIICPLTSDISQLRKHCLMNKCLTNW